MLPSTEKLLSPEPQVRLEKAFANAFRNVVATAQTCYSGKGIVRDDEIMSDFKGLAKSIYEAGHHTTLQHAHFQFSLSNVSRQFIWSFLHSHPFYNSEQVSQRYVPMKPKTTSIPRLGDPEAQSLFERTVQRQH